MNIDQGFFKLDFADHHAVLGVPIDADAKDARKRYLKIARRLHPDSLTTASEAEKHQASEILSKLVNPAYETLSQEKAASEHALVLRLRGQQLHLQSVELTSEAARALLSSNNLDYAYTTAVKALAEKQYDILNDVFAVIGQISELNLVYMMRKAGSPTPLKAAPVSSTASDTAPEAPTNPRTAPTMPPPARRYRETILEGYLNRARELEYKQDYPKAILELREALRAFPNNGGSHSQLANVYLKAGQQTMARIHANRALEINPEDEVAQRIQKQLEKTGSTSKPRESSPSSQSGSKPRGGLFGLFGGKKK